MDGIFTIGEEKELNSNGHQQQNDLSISPSTSNLNIDNLVFNSNSSSPGIFFLKKNLGKKIFLKVKKQKQLLYLWMEEYLMFILLMILIYVKVFKIR